jgi:hypothetical protein
VRTPGLKIETWATHLIFVRAIFIFLVGRRPIDTPVDMTKERSVAGEKLQIPPLRSPGFPVEIRGVDQHHAVFLEEKPHTRPLPAA